MSGPREVRVPDIGDFTDVDIIEVHVTAGDTVAEEDALITLETDKAAMEVPAPFAGTVSEVTVAVGDKVSEGDVIALVSEAGSGDAPAATGEPSPETAPADAGSTPAPAPAAPPLADGDADQSTQLLVLGAGVGGYAAAFRAADLGLKVTLVERWPTLGGVCLNVGCIPSKALLHVAKVMDEAATLSDHGISYGEPEIDKDKLRQWKDSVVGKLTGGLDGLAKQRKVNVVRGTGRFLSPHRVEVTDGDQRQVIGFEQCVIAVGSEPFMLPGLPDDERIIDSTGALELKDLPEKMLVVGGGIIGLEMACVYDALGVNITVVELTDTLIPEADRDLVRPLQKRIEKQYRILLGTKLASAEAAADGIRVTFEGKNAPDPDTFGLVLIATGRVPNGKHVDATNAGVTVDDRGFIPSDNQMRTNVPHIFAVGDVRGQPMLAHKGTHEGRLAAEVAAGEKRAFDARVIPSVAYTDPEVAWVGLTENEAKAKGITFGKGVFPWAANGRSLSQGRSEGLTKLLFDEKTERLLGVGIVGPHAGDIIAEAGLAIEMGCDAADIGHTIHAHPTLSETFAMAAEAYEGTITDLYMPKKKKRG